MREVALTYRRKKRAAQPEGVKPPELYHRAHEALHGPQLLLATGDTC